MLDIVKQPDPFKKETKWKRWKESVLTYLDSKNWHANLPLAYIVLEIDVHNYNKIVNTMHDQLVKFATLHGPENDNDNGLVYHLLQSLMLNGPAWSWIKMYQNTRDGQNSWKSLKSIFYVTTQWTMYPCVTETGCAMHHSEKSKATVFYDFLFHLGCLSYNFCIFLS